MKYQVPCRHRGTLPPDAPANANLLVCNVQLEEKISLLHRSYQEETQHSKKVIFDKIACRRGRLEW